LAENTSDLDTAASDVEKMLSRKKRTRNLISDDDDVEPETTPKAHRPPGKKLRAKKRITSSTISTSEITDNINTSSRAISRHHVK